MTVRKTTSRGGLSVEVRNGNIEKAIRLLGKKVKDEGIVRELRARQAYEKPSEKRRRKAGEAKRRAAKAARKVVE